jgi:single-strand DNA-binding protein
MNSINLTGRLAKDMEVKPTQSGKSWLRYSIAVSIYDGKAEKKEKTLWVNCSQFFGFSENYLGKKGDLIGITGELDFWEAGEKKVQMIYAKVSKFDILQRKTVEKVQENFSGTDVTGEVNPFDDSDLPF